MSIKKIPLHCRVPFFDYPSKNDYYISIICLQGKMEGSINLMPYTLSANHHITIFPDQMAFFYSAFDIFSRDPQLLNRKRSRKEILFEEFYKMVLAHYTESREIGFYADKLCLTPKYLSTTIKELTGKSAYEWINDHVILEAKALLRSSRLSIQEISISLSFPNQSFFGKFFKQHTGVSPKEYRNQKKP